MKRFLLVAAICVAWQPGYAPAQTAVDLRRQARNVDFSNASSTKPSKTGTSLPANCTVGEMFFKTNAPAGANLYGCGATNTWSLMAPDLSDTGVNAGVYGDAAQVPQLTVDSKGRITAAAMVPVTMSTSLPDTGVAAGVYGSSTQVPQVTVDAKGRITAAAMIQVSASGQGSGATSASQLLDWKVERTTSAALTIGGNCATLAPCTFRFGAVTTAVTAPMTATITGATTAGAAFIYLNPTGSVVVGYPTGMTLVCAGGCMAQSGVTAFPADSIPIYTWAATSIVGQWDATGTDKRSIYNSKAILAGVGIVRVDNPITGASTLSADRALIGFRVGVPATATAACSSADWAADGSYLYVCVADNQWKRAALAAW